MISLCDTIIGGLLTVVLCIFPLWDYLIVFCCGCREGFGLDFSGCVVTCNKQLHKGLGNKFWHINFGSFL